MNADTQNVDELRALMRQEATELFEGDARAAERWLISSQRALGNRPPFGLMGTAAGIQKIRTLIGQLEHGVVP
jgi:putative toxin-antitoxin system antitoxin component (TIGR02293 family)